MRNFNPLLSLLVVVALLVFSTQRSAQGNI